MLYEETASVEFKKYSDRIRQAETCNSRDSNHLVLSDKDKQVLSHYKLRTGDEVCYIQMSCFARVT